MWDTLYCIMPAPAPCFLLPAPAYDKATTTWAQFKANACIPRRLNMPYGTDCRGSRCGIQLKNELGTL